MVEAVARARLSEGRLSRPFEYFSKRKVIMNVCGSRKNERMI